MLVPASPCSLNSFIAVPEAEPTDLRQAKRPSGRPQVPYDHFTRIWKAA